MNELLFFRSDGHRSSRHLYGFDDGSSPALPNPGLMGSTVLDLLMFTLGIPVEERFDADGSSDACAAETEVGAEVILFGTAG